MKYYVDCRIGEVVAEEDIDTDFLAPELFYEYWNNGSKSMIIETWEVSPNGMIDFAYLISEKQPKGFDLYRERQSHFEEHGVKPYRLKAYGVPDKWFKEQIEKLKGCDED